MGVRGIVFKRGMRGVHLSVRDGVDISIPAFPVRAIDTTAAGDAFNGAFATGLMLGKDPVESARFASAAAAISVTRPGVQPSMPSLEETEAFIVHIPTNSFRRIGHDAVASHWAAPASCPPRAVPPWHHLETD
jgi:sugar/nucleoside kinase (ribokinase family)